MAFPVFEKRPDESMAPAPAAKPKSAPVDPKALEQAVQLITDLRYKEGADLLHHLLPRLEAAGDLEGVAEAKFWLGYCDEKQGRLREAAEAYSKVVQDYTDTEAARMARLRLLDLAPPPE